MNAAAMRSAQVRWCCVVLIAVLGATLGSIGDAVFAAPRQSTTSSIRGVVLDATGAVLVGASLTLTHPDTNRVLRQSSKDDGAFEFLGLPPGRYRLAVGFDGFTVDERDVEIAADQDRRLTAVLRLAGRTQTVDVVAPAQLTDQVKTALGRTITPAELEQLPVLAPRDFAALATLAAGVLPATNGASSGFAVSGQTMTSNTTLIDGLSVDGVTFSPALETIREYRIVTNHFAAEFGQASGAVVSVISKAGSNDPAGRLYLLSAAPRVGCDISPRQTCRYE